MSPRPIPICTTCGKPADPHPYRHPITTEPQPTEVRDTETVPASVSRADYDAAMRLLGLDPDRNLTTVHLPTPRLTGDAMTTEHNEPRTAADEFVDKAADTPYRYPDLAPNAVDFMDSVRAAGLPVTESGEPDWEKIAAQPMTVPVIVPTARMRIVSLPARPDGTIPFLIVFDRCAEWQMPHLAEAAPLLTASTGAVEVLSFSYPVDLDNAEWDEETTRKALGPHLADDILTHLGRWSS